MSTQVSRQRATHSKGFARMTQRQRGNQPERLVCRGRDGRPDPSFLIHGDREVSTQGITGRSRRRTLTDAPSPTRSDPEQGSGCPPQTLLPPRASWHEELVVQASHVANLDTDRSVVPTPSAQGNEGVTSSAIREMNRGFPTFVWRRSLHPSAWKVFVRPTKPSHFPIRNKDPVAS